MSDSSIPWSLGDPPHKSDLAFLPRDPPKDSLLPNSPPTNLSSSAPHTPADVFHVVPDRLPSLSPLPPEMQDSTEPEPTSLPIHSDSNAGASNPPVGESHTPPIGPVVIVSDAAPEGAAHVSNNSIDHLTPLTDVPSEDDQVEQELSRDQEVDEGYQSGDPSPPSAREKLPPEDDRPLPKADGETSDLKSKPAVDAKSDAKQPDQQSPSSQPLSEPTKGERSSSQPVASSPPSINGVPPPTPSSSQSQPLEADNKVSILLELNAELIKIYADFQTRNLHNSPECLAYASRLQSNLTWLAWSGDKSRSESAGAVSLPVMEAPPVAALVDGARLKQLYEKLPTVFVKELAKRQRQVLKRERTPDDVGNISRKRQDLGDSKLSSIPPPGPQPLDLPLMNGVIPNSSANSLTSPQFIAPPQPLPSAQPHNLPQSGLGNVQIAHVSRLAQSASSSDLQRQLQMRQLTQRQAGHGSSPPPPPQLRSAPPGQPGDSFSHAGSPIQQQQTSQPPGPESLTQEQMQKVYQELQNPNNQFTRFMLARDPTFMARPPIQQVQAWQQWTLMAQARRQAQVQAQAPQHAQMQIQMQQHHQQQMVQQGQQHILPGNRMTAQPPPPISTSQNASLGANTFRPGTAMSGQALGMSPQQALQPSSAGSSTMPDASSPFNSSAMIARQTPRPQSRPGSSGQFNLASSNMTPQQRQQLMLMQQQQLQQQPHVRNMHPHQAGSPPAYGVVPAQLPVQHSPIHAESPGLMDAHDGLQHPARPGSVMAGMQRSTRSPSEPIGTPTKRHMSFSGSENAHAPFVNPVNGSPILTQQAGQMPQYQQVPNQIGIAPSQTAAQAQPGWPGGFNGGMNPAAFQLNNASNTPTTPQFVNPSVLGAGVAHGANMGQGQWIQSNGQYNQAPSPSPSMHEGGSMSRHASATPGPGPQLNGDGTQFDTSMYGWS